MFKRQIRKGVRALNKHFGNTEWVQRISVPHLFMQDCSSCVAGQLFGSYDQMPPNDLPNPRNDNDSATYGFYVCSIDDKDWDQLSTEWKQELRKL